MLIGFFCNTSNSSDGDYVYFEKNEMHIKVRNFERPIQK